VWLARLEDAGVPVALVNDVVEAGALVDGR
jgi:hypothetical protein